MVDQILFLEEQDTDAAIAFLLEGPGSPAMLLIISWPTLETALMGLESMSRCGAWQMEANDKTLVIAGQGQLMLLSGEVAQATYFCQWEIEDDYVVSLFARHCQLQGFFIVVPAVNKEILSTVPPFPCYLM
jgi:hypothetical protein